MLVFNHSGLLVPDTLISSTKEEFEKEFVFNISTKKRVELYTNFVNYNSKLKSELGLSIIHQWINGSFVSKKSTPGDIDLVTFLDYQIVQKLGEKLNKFKFPFSEEIFGVDAYFVEVYPENHIDWFKYISDKAYWHDRFTKTRRIRGNKLSKGFLEIYS